MGTAGDGVKQIQLPLRRLVNIGSAGPDRTDSGRQTVLVTRTTGRPQTHRHVKARIFTEHGRGVSNLKHFPTRENDGRRDSAAPAAG